MWWPTVRVERADYGVQQGSVLGLLLFIVYAAELCSLITTPQLLYPHQYAVVQATIERIKRSTSDMEPGHFFDPVSGDW